MHDITSIEEKIEYALSYISKIDLQQQEVGKYIINEDIFYLIQEYEIAPNSNSKLESHISYVDIQGVISGKEIIKFVDTHELKLKEAYDEEKDVMFWHSDVRMQEVLLTPGSYIVFYPNNAHMPCLSKSNKNVMVKKIVVKIKM